MDRRAAKRTVSRLETYYRSPNGALRSFGKRREGRAQHFAAILCSCTTLLLVYALWALFSDIRGPLRSQRNVFGDSPSESSNGRNGEASVGSGSTGERFPVARSHMRMVHADITATDSGVNSVTFTYRNATHDHCTLYSVIPYRTNFEIVRHGGCSVKRKLKWHQLSSQYGTQLPNCECCAKAPLGEADVVFAHPHKTRLVRHHKTQRWVAQFWESEANYPPLNPLRDYDATKSYRLDSTFPCFAMITDTFNPHALMPIIPYDEKLTEEMMSVWLTNCGGRGRNRLLKSLTRITKASYGRCGHDHSEQEPTKFHTELDRSSQAGGIQKMVHAAKYLFLFAAENSISPYYHTEKLFHGLMAGTIPVYHGADTVDDFVPNHSIIKFSDWGAGLEDYLLRIAGNRTLYESYFEWRTHPLPKSMAFIFKPCPTVCEIGALLRTPSLQRTPKDRREGKSPLPSGSLKYEVPPALLPWIGELQRTERRSVR